MFKHITAILINCIPNFTSEDLDFNNFESNPEYKLSGDFFFLLLISYKKTLDHPLFVCLSTLNLKQLHGYWRCQSIVLAIAEMMCSMAKLEKRKQLTLRSNKYFLI